MQTLRQMLGATKAKADMEKKTHPEGAEAKVEKSFHQKERDRQSKDPNNSGYLGAVAMGKARTKQFMLAVHDAGHPDHEKNFRVFKSAYGTDSTKMGKQESLTLLSRTKSSHCHHRKLHKFRSHIHQIHFFFS
jgi:hypothetical protein